MPDLKRMMSVVALVAVGCGDNGGASPTDATSIVPVTDGTTTATVTSNTDEPTSPPSTEGTTAHAAGTTTTTTAPTNPSSTTATTGTSSGACPDQLEANDCCCFEVIEEGLAHWCLPEPPCGLLWGKCVDKDAIDCNVEPRLADTVECMLSALQANEAGYFDLAMGPANAPFDWAYGIRLFSDGAGTVFWLDYLSDSDFTHYYGGVKRFEIASLGLDACSALPQANADARFDCMRAAFVEGEPLEVCIDPYIQP